MTWAIIGPLRVSIDLRCLFGLIGAKPTCPCNTYNADDQKAAILGNNERSGVTYSFVNLDKIHVPEKTALSYLSSDNFHPNYRGYQSLANFVAESVVVRSKNQNIFLANK